MKFLDNGMLKSRLYLAVIWTRVNANTSIRVVLGKCNSLCRIMFSGINPHLSDGTI